MKNQFSKRKSLGLIILSFLIFLTVIGSYIVLPTSKKIQPIDISNLPELQVGDWVFRMGTSLDSRLIRQFGKSKYSHIGVIVETAPKPLVIHATTDDGYKEKNQVLLTPLNEFFSPSLATDYAIVRPNILNKEQNTQMAKDLRKRLGEKFVLTNKNEPNLYCTTLIYQEIIKQKPDFSVKWSELDVSFFEGEYLLPISLFNLPNNKIIYQSSP